MRAKRRCSYSQEGVWLAQQAHPQSVTYNLVYSCVLEGALDSHALERALRRVVQRHEVLRCTFQIVEGQLVGEPLPTESISLRIERAQAPRCRAELLKWVESKRDLPFDLSQEPPIRAHLLRLNATRSAFCLVVHHIAIDGYSLRFFLEDLEAAYSSRSLGGGGPAPQTFWDFANWQREYLSSTEAERSKTFWKEELRDAPRGVLLPLDRRGARSGRGGAATHLVAQHTLDRLNDNVVRPAKTSLHAILFSLFRVFAHRLSRQDDLLLGTVASGRTRADFLHVVGCVSNPLLLRSHAKRDDTLHELISESTRQLGEALARQDYPFSEVVVDSNLAGRSAGQLPYSMSFVFHSARQLGRFGALLAPEVGATGTSFAELKAKNLWVPQQLAQFELGFDCIECDAGLLLQLKYREGLDRVTAEAWLAAYVELLEASIRLGPEAEVDALDWVVDEQVVTGWAQFDVGNRPLRIDSSIELAARATPAATAIEHGARHCSYSELSSMVHRLTAGLRSAGVCAEDRVGVLLPQSPERIALALSIWRCGAVLVSLEEDNPDDRLQHMIAAASVRVVIGTRAQTGRVGSVCSVVTIDSLDGGERSGATWEVELSPEQPAYVIFTSGTTGIPKGVVVSHRAIARTLHHLNEVMRVDGTTRFAQYSSCGFDASFNDTFAALMVGGTVVIIDRRKYTEPAALTEALATTRTTTLLSSPTLLSQLDPARLPELEHVVSVGEACPESLVERWSSRSFYNGYGPSEAAMCTTLGRVTPQAGRRPSLGLVIGARTVHLLDERLRPVPRGTVGEIVISGPDIADGYLGQSQDNDRFIDLSLSGTVTRAYRSGDLARQRADGCFEFMGRRDRQLQIRGMRVEPAEIEACLRQLHGVRDAHVVLRHETQHLARLVGYVVADKDSIQVPQLRQQLASRLPGYMVPTAFAILANFPRTPSGKLDEARLPKPEVARVSPSQPAREHNWIEERVADVWKTLLALEDVGVDDNFFDLGGHSLLLAQVHQELTGAGFALTVIDLLKHPTIRAIASHLEQGPTQTAERTQHASNVARRRQAYRRRRREGAL